MNICIELIYSALFVLELLREMAMSENVKVMPTSDNKAYEASDVEGVGQQCHTEHGTQPGPQNEPPIYTVPFLQLETQTTAL